MAKQIKLWVYVAAVSSANTLYLHIDQDVNNWGNVLDANMDDFISTDTIYQSSTYIGGTGWKSFLLNETDIDFSKVLWIRLSSELEGQAANKLITINSQNASSNKPYLQIIDLGSGRPCNIPLLGAG